MVLAVDTAVSDHIELSLSQNQNDDSNLSRLTLKTDRTSLFGDSRSQCSELTIRGAAASKQNGFKSESRQTKQVENEVRASTMERMPDDTLLSVFEYLDVKSLARLQQVNKRMARRVIDLGVPLYLVRHPQHHITLHPPPPSWYPPTLLAHNHRIITSLTSHKLHALQIGPEFRSSVIPTLSLSSDRLVLGVGGSLIVHPFLPLHLGEMGGKRVGIGLEYKIVDRPRGTLADIVGVREMGKNDLAIAQFDGTLQRVHLITLDSSKRSHDQQAYDHEHASTSNPYNRHVKSNPDGFTPKGQIHSTAHYIHPTGSSIYTFTSDGDTLLTTTSTNVASLFNGASPWIPPVTTHLSSRAWSSLVCKDQGKVIFGLNGGISVMDLDRMNSVRTLTGREIGKSAAYSLCFPPLSSNKNKNEVVSIHHPSLLLSAWHDTFVRLHDLRSPNPGPVLNLHDPWSDTAMYSATYVGETHVAAGHAQHGTVTLFDLRNTIRSYSIFSPGGKGSPVYALEGEGGRVWGVTEKRAFVLTWDASGRYENSGVEVRSSERTWGSDGDVASSTSQSGLGMIMPKPTRGLIDATWSNTSIQQSVRGIGRGTLPSVASGTRRSGSGSGSWKEVPSGYKPRGGKWGWTVRYGKEAEREVCIGYEHRSNGMKLFETLDPSIESYPV